MLGSASLGDAINDNNLPRNGSAIPIGSAGLDWNNVNSTPSARLPGNSGMSFAYDNGGAPAWFRSPGTFTFTRALLGHGQIEPQHH